MCVFAALPFVVHPQQVWPQDDGDVPGRHLVHVLMLSQFGEEFDQIPDGRKHTPKPSVGTRNGGGANKWEGDSLHSSAGGQLAPTSQL